MIATNIQLPQRFDASMNPIDRLHPTKAGYDLNETPLSSANLVLDTESVEQGQFIRMFDTYGAVDLFRVDQTKTKYTKGLRNQTVKLEHALTTLNDVLIPGYREFGGTGVSTATVLTQMLAMQPVTYWVLGTCEYTDQYMYSTEKELLINAILSVAFPLTTPYRWTFNTSVFPFVLNLVRASSVPNLEFRMNRNVNSVTHSIDRRDLRTRLYPLGYGEGVNQLGIADVNGGVAYLDKNTATYGIVSDVFVDTSITDAGMLKDTAQAYLDVVSEPYVTTEVDGLDVFHRTGEQLDAPRLGAVARVPIADYGISLSERVIRVVKTDIYGAPHKAKVTLTNQTRDAVRETAALMRKSRIGDLYSQGSISFVPEHFADNADASNALECDFYIDAQEININQVLCKFKLEAFRSYSNVSAAGGGQTRTSGSGGGESLTSGPNNVSNTGIASGDTGSPSSNYTGVSSGDTGSGGSGDTGSSGADTSSAGGTTGSTYTDVVGMSSSADGSSGSHSHASGTYTAASHTHSAPSHSHSVYGHTHAGPSHTHSLNAHTHSLNLHTHSLGTHTHSLNNHTHSVTTSGHSHSVTIDDHTHALVHGIYRGTTASSVTVAVDGNALDPGDITSNQFDAVPYLAKDSNGKITRNTWHKISFTPDTLTRIVADIQKKTFVRAVSGGNY